MTFDADQSREHLDAGPKICTSSQTEVLGNDQALMKALDRRRFRFATSCIEFRERPIRAAKV